MVFGIDFVRKYPNVIFFSVFNCCYRVLAMIYHLPLLTCNLYNNHTYQHLNTIRESIDRNVLSGQVLLFKLVLEIDIFR